MKNVFGEFLDAVKWNVKLRQGGVSLGSPRELKTDIRTYNVYVNDDMLRFQLGMPADVPAVGVAPVATGLFSTNVQAGYICNEKFWNMDYEFKRAMMAHEEAHIYYNDVKIGEKVHPLAHTVMMIKRSFKELDFEYRADRYAYDLIGADFIAVLLRYHKEYPKSKHMLIRMKRLMEYANSK